MSRPGSVSERLPEIAAALLDLPHDHLPEPHRSWMREQYGRAVPVVLVDALRAVEEGELLSAKCVARLQELAADTDETDVPLAVTLRGAAPAIRVFCAFVQQSADGARAVHLMARASVVAQELGSIWVEARLRGRAPAAVGAAQPREPDGDEELEPVDERMLELVAEGRSNAEIATVTHYSRQAVGWRLSRLMRRWRAANRAALVAAAFARGALVPRAGGGRTHGGSLRAPPGRAPSGHT